MLQKKICLLGASGVGKTSLIKQYVEGIFAEKYLTSIGVKIDKKAIQLEADSVQLIIWDLEGVDRYCGFQPKYLRGASAIAIVTDQTRPQSFADGMEVLQKVRELSDVPAILIINKADLAPAWRLGDEQVKPYVAQFSQHFSTSAKTGEQVEEMFTALAQLTLR